MDSWDHFGSLGCRIGEGPFFYVSILFLGSVLSMVFLEPFYCCKLYELEKVELEANAPISRDFIIHNDPIMRLYCKYVVTFCVRPCV